MSAGPRVLQLRVDERHAAEDRGAERETAVGRQRHAVREHRPVELHRQARDRVATVVRLREEDHVGVVLAGELRDRRRRDLTGQTVARIDHEQLRRAVLAD